MSLLELASQAILYLEDIFFGTYNLREAEPKEGRWM